MPLIFAAGIVKVLTICAIAQGEKVCYIGSGREIVIKDKGKNGRKT